MKGIIYVFFLPLIFYVMADCTDFWVTDRRHIPTSCSILDCPSVILLAALHCIEGAHYKKHLKITVYDKNKSTTF